MNIIWNSNKGFTLGEVLMTISIIAVACALVVPAVTRSVEWASERNCLRELHRLNDALDYYKLEHSGAALPRGRNDKAHHAAILQILDLNNIGHIDLRQLKSQGEGDTFYFTEYKGKRYEKSKYTDGKVNDQPYSPTSKIAEGDRNKDWNHGSIPLDESFFVQEEFSKGNVPFKEKRDEKMTQAVEEFFKHKRPKQPLIERKVHFEMPGYYDWIVPQGVSDIQVELIGGGGSGSRMKRRVKGWGDIQAILLQPVVVGRYACDNGNYVSVGSFAWVGPLKLYIYTSAISFVQGFKVVTNGIHHQLAIGQENVVEHSQEGPISVEVFLQTPGAQAGCWKKGRKHFQMRYHDDFSFGYNLRVQFQDIDFFVGNGGGAGGHSIKTFRGLRGGETVFVTVGAGGRSGLGGTTKVKINDIECSASGGGMGTEQAAGAGGTGQGDHNKNGLEGLLSEKGGQGGKGVPSQSNGNAIMGTGGAGAYNKEAQSGGDGHCGMVVITYKG